MVGGFLQKHLIHRKVGGRSKGNSLSLACARQLPQRGSLIAPYLVRGHPTCSIHPLGARIGCRPSPTANWLSALADPRAVSLFLPQTWCANWLSALADQKPALSEGKSFFSFCFTSHKIKKRIPEERHYVRKLSPLNFI